jgi:hypothetical protein
MLKPLPLWVEAFLLPIKPKFFLIYISFISALDHGTVTVAHLPLGILNE